MKQIRLNQGNSLGCVSPLLVAPLVESFLESMMDTKICSKCGDPKLLTEFYKNRSRKDGLYSACKKCSNASNLKCYYKHRAERIAYSRKHYHNHREEKAVYAREYYREHKVEKARYSKAYRAKFPERTEAQHAVERAIASGKLIRPDRCSNPRCNRLCVPEGHHWSYLEEHWLDVEWLCTSCHKFLHAKERFGDSN